MQRTPSLLGTFAKLAACFVLTLAATVQSQAADKVDPSGTWTWTTPGRDGGPGRTSTLKLKLDGDKLTGSLSAPGRQGAEAREVAISDASLKGDEIAFTVKREFNGNTFAAKYSGKVVGDSIKGKVETEREGNARSRDWEAKREAAKK